MLYRNIVLITIVISLNFVDSTKRYFKIFVVDVKAYEPYANVSFFNLTPLGKHLAVIDGEGYLKQEFKNGMVWMYKFMNKLKIR